MLQLLAKLAENDEVKSEFEKSEATIETLMNFSINRIVSELEFWSSDIQNTINTSSISKCNLRSLKGMAQHILR